MARTRLGKGAVSFTVGGVEYNLDVTSAVLDSEEADGGLVTFADIGGSFKWYFEITAAQSLDTASLHAMLWNNVGKAGTAAFVFAPNGAGSGKKQWSGTVQLPTDGAAVGGEANSEWSFDKRFEVVGTPTVTTPV